MIINESSEKASKVAAIIAGLATFAYCVFSSDSLLLAFIFGWIPGVVAAIFAFFVWSTKYVFIAAFAFLLLLIAISNFN